MSKELAEGGAKVALVEAGREIRREEFNYHAWPYEFPNRKKPSPGYPYAAAEPLYSGFDICFQRASDLRKKPQNKNVHQKYSHDDHGR